MAEVSERAETAARPRSTHAGGRSSVSTAGAMRIVATAEVPAVAREAFARAGRDRRARHRRSRRARRRRGADRARRAPRRARRSPRAAGCGRSRARAPATTTSTSRPPRAAAIPIVYAPGVGSGPIAEGTVALIFAATKRLRELGGLVHGDAWHSRYDVVGLDLDGACLGIVGLGAIGRHVARLSAGARDARDRPRSGAGARRRRRRRAGPARRAARPGRRDLAALRR